MACSLLGSIRSFIFRPDANRTSRSPEDVNNLLATELSLTTTALKAHPKVYWVWNHRRWCLENVPDGPGEEESADRYGWKQANWDKELFVVEKMLDADARNCAIMTFKWFTSRISHIY